jgi:ribosomal protein L11 methyltransferase
MKTYLQYEFFTTDANEQEWLMALLGELNFEGFEQKETGVLAFVPQEAIADGEVRLTLDENNLSHIQFAVLVVEPKNWNQEWESNFPPVIIAEKVGIRAPFHEKLNTPIELVIEPKMSFGTGHHATTSLMVELLLSMDLQGKTLLDMGSGTGVLAILANKLGVAKPVAVDHEEWAYENAIENAQRNDATIEVFRADASMQFANDFDVVLANINRHVIEDNLQHWLSILKNKGLIALSGFIAADVLAIQKLGSSQGLVEVHQKQKGEWVAMLFQKV